MNKTTVLKTMQSIIAEEYNVKLKQEKIEDLLEIFTKTYEALWKELEEGESVNVGITVLTKKKVAARKGVSKLRGKEVEWSSPEKIKLSITAKKSFEKEHEEEL